MCISIQGVRQQYAKYLEIRRVLGIICDKNINIVFYIIDSVLRSLGKCFMSLRCTYIEIKQMCSTTQRYLPYLIP
jgi:hypothetical protein